MSRMTKKLAVSLVSAAMISSFGLLQNQVLAQESNGAVVTHANLQLVADQLTVGSGGTAKFHIIYHNVENKNQSHVWLKIKVPKGFELDLKDEDNNDKDPLVGDVVWEELTRTLKWKVDDVKADGAVVVHFNLKASADLPNGSIHTIVPELETPDAALPQIPLTPVSVKVGPQIDQPFFKGYPNGNFQPTTAITRGEMAAVVARIKNLDQSGTLTKTYTDLPSDHWAYNYVKAVTNAGYMKGFDDGSFRADQPITRAELVALVLRLRGISEVPLGAFNDIDDHWAQNVIGTAKALKIIDGLTPDSFNPNGFTERQQAAKLINIALFRGPLVDGDNQVVQHFPDVPKTGWSFHWVEEASMVAHEAEFRSDAMEHLIRYLPDQTEAF